jgi:acyl carrier protein
MKKEEVLMVIYSEVTKHAKTRNIKPLHKLIELGGHSLVIAEIISGVEARLNVKILDYVVKNNPTLDALSKHIIGLADK